MDPLFEALVRQTPSTVALRMILDRIIPGRQLDYLFDEIACRQRQRTLLFSQLIDLCLDVVLREQPSVHAAFRQHAPRLEVAFKSVYNKLNGTELPLSAALVAESAERADSSIRSMNGAEPPWVAGYRCRILDGNGLRATEHRIEELRSIWDAPLPGKVLAVMDQETRLVTDVFLTPDGHAQERSLLPEVISSVGAKDLWIADANFCTHQFLHEIDSRGAGFVVRRHGQVKGREPGGWSPAIPAATGLVSEQSLDIVHEGLSKTFRRVRIVLAEPTRDGRGEVDVLTNLPPEVSTLEVAELYRRRWGIETLFWELSATLSNEPKSLCQPRAFLLLFCLGLAASNAVKVFEAGVRVVHGAAVWETMSLYALMWEVCHSSELVGSLVEEGIWQELAGLEESRWLAELRRILAGLNMSRYRKAKKRARHPPKRKTAKYTNGGHASTHKLMQARIETDTN